MFYCDRCANQRGWPEGFGKSWNACELCGRMVACNDVPLSALPEPKKEIKK